MESSELPAVNAIVPICNRVDRLEECRKRLTTQKYEGQFTITAVERYSQDGTIDVVKEYGRETLIKRNAPIEVITGLTNFGMQNSNADLLCKVDADNIIADDEVLFKLSKPFLQDSSIIFSVSRRFTIK